MESDHQVPTTDGWLEAELDIKKNLTEKFISIMTSAWV